MYTDNYDTDLRTTSRGSSFLMGMLCGAAVGAAVGLLMAPSSGADFRGQLSDSAERLRRKAGEGYDRAASTVDDLIGRGKRAARRGRETFDEVRQTAAGAMDDMADMADESV
jgi:gas vesicle protein